jgi:uncharacterized membrane protein YpjA
MHYMHYMHYMYTCMQVHKYMAVQARLLGPIFRMRIVDNFLCVVTDPVRTEDCIPCPVHATRPHECTLLACTGRDHQDLLPRRGL